MAEVEAGDCRIRYDVFGDAAAPPLVLIPALGTTRELFDPQLAALGARRRLVRVDLRGHGESDAPGGPYTVERLAFDVLAVLDAEAIARADVLGVSIGGLIALWLAAHAPARVSSAVVANSAARVGTWEQWQERIELVQSRGIEVMRDGMLERWFSEAFRREQAATVEAFGERLLACRPQGYVGCCSALASADLREAVARISCPCLIVTGEHDQATPPADGEWLACRIPGAERVSIEAAHFANVERPATFNEAVLKFLGA